MSIKMSAPMFVYFVQMVESGRIKIGRSRNVAQRIATLQTASPEELRLLGVIPGDERVERELHQKHAQYHLRGEWYIPGVGLLDDIARRIGANTPTPEQVASLAKAAAASSGPVWANRSAAGSIGAHISWANTKDRTARTASARAGLERKFLAEAEGDPVRAAHLRTAYYKRLALKSAQARAARKAGAN